MSPEEDVLKLLHTADWHLGRRFPRFGAEASRTLSRARLDVLERLFREAEHNQVHAVLCAGDLFDEPSPEQPFRDGLTSLLRRLNWKDRLVVLLPGNHDPLLPSSVWKDPAFRAALPDFVRVVDQPLLELELREGCVLYAVPCESQAGQLDPSTRIPPRAPGDTRVRVGLVHGSTFDLPEARTNFPVSRDAAVDRGLDYLALGDTHGFRFVPADRKLPPTIYPGAPEPTAFDEVGAGAVALVFFNRRREALVQQRPVARWTWEQVRIGSLDELRLFARRADLGSRVVRLELDLDVSAPEYREVEALLAQLSGSEATHARVGVLEVDREGLRLDLRALEELTRDLPSVLRRSAEALRDAARQPESRAAAERALFHLFALTRKATG